MSTTTPPVLDYKNPWEDPPPGFPATIDEDADGVSIRFPPTSTWAYFVDFAGFALLAVICVWSLVAAIIEQVDSDEFWVIVLADLIFLVLIAYSCLTLWSRATRPTTFRVQNGRFALTRPGILGDRSFSWSSNSVVHATPILRGVIPLFPLCASIRISLRGGYFRRALHRRRWEDVKWAARVLNRLLEQHRGGDSVDARS